MLKRTDDEWGKRNPQLNFKVKRRYGNRISIGDDKFVIGAQRCRYSFRDGGSAMDTCMGQASAEGTYAIRHFCGQYRQIKRLDQAPISARWS